MKKKTKKEKTKKNTSKEKERIFYNNDGQGSELLTFMQI